MKKKTKSEHEEGCGRNWY